MTAYYNENEPYAAEWLRNLVREGLIADGYVDDRSIEEVAPADLADYQQCHFFAGLGGWSGALRFAGVPDDTPLWTGSCPCQPFSLAGTQKGFDDKRHLWPDWQRLIAQCRPAIVLGEQVASAAQWLRLVRSDLEALDYAVGCVPVEAASAGAYHLRDRYWFVADRVSPRLAQRTGNGRIQRQALGSFQGKDVADACPAFGMADTAGFSKREPDHQGDTVTAERQARSVPGGEGAWVVGADGKARRVEPGIRLLAHGVPNRVAKLRALGNAIDLRPAAAFIRAAL